MSRPQHRRQPRRRPCVVRSGGGWQQEVAALAEKVRARIEWELNYENWAPRGARAFRLRELPPELQQRDADKGRDAGSQASDNDLASDLEAALEAMRDGPEGSGPLTGEELMVLSLGKYSVAYDMAIKQVDVMSGSVDRFVALNIYGGHLHQKSFPLSREQYLEKLDAIAMALNAWGQAEYIRTWFKQPAAPRAGLPSRPRVDTAVSVRLNNSPTWDPAVAERWFSS